MNRRRFFSLVAGVAPALFLPKLIAPVWKRTRGLADTRWEINPEWINAPFEIAWIGPGTIYFNKKTVDPVAPGDCWRYTQNKETGLFERVDKYLSHKLIDGLSWTGV
jgi:hypothetical protein